jgi:hypothetical protein
MNFTPKIDVRVVRGILILAAVGLVGSVGHVAYTPVPVPATQSAFAGQESFQTSDAVMIIPEAGLATVPGFQTTRPDYYQPVTHWYNSKGWWKRNAPIVGGAGGGALVGGLVGGGKGALIGGAVGGGGGYLYKHYHHHHHHHNYYR